MCLSLQVRFQGRPGELPASCVMHPEPRGHLQRRPATGVESSSSGHVAHENGAPSEELLTAKRANAMETVTVPFRLLWFWNCFPSPFPKLPPKYFASGKTSRNET